MMTAMDNPTLAPYAKDSEVLLRLTQSLVEGRGGNDDGARARKGGAVLGDINTASTRTP
jgi:hypothetical protein